MLFKDFIAKTGTASKVLEKAVEQADFPDSEEAIVSYLIGERQARPLDIKIFKQAWAAFTEV